MAHYLTSIPKNATRIDDLVPGCDAVSTAENVVGEWWSLFAGPGHDATEVVIKIRNFGGVQGLQSEDGQCLSIAQWCDKSDETM